MLQIYRIVRSSPVHSSVQAIPQILVRRAMWSQTNAKHWRFDVLGHYHADREKIIPSSSRRLQALCQM